MSVSRAVAAHVEALPSGSFVRAMDFPGYSRGAVDTSLHRLLGTRSDFARVARGLYWKGVSSRFGPGRPAAVDAAIAAAGPDSGIGPATWLAAHTVGISTQLPSMPELAVIGSSPVRVSGVRFRRRSNIRRIGLRFHEVALVEVLRDWPGFSEATWSDLVAAIRRLVESGVVDIERVESAVRNEPSTAARANFGQLQGDLSPPGLLRVP